MNQKEWYAKLKKPSWAPPSRVFGPVWMVLYVIIAVSFGSVFLMAYRGDIPSSVAVPFIINLVFNFAFTPIQFGLKNNDLAMIDILLVLFTLVWAMISIFPYSEWIAYAQIPYLLWVGFATALQMTITYLNK